MSETRIAWRLYRTLVANGVGRAHARATALDNLRQLRVMSWGAQI